MKSFPTDASLSPSTDQVDDAEVIARVKAGDTEAFGDLVDRYRGAVYRAAFCALGAAADAEDVTQETFMSAFLRLSSFRGESTFKTWLLAIAWHQALDRRRSLLGRLRTFVSKTDLHAWEDPPSEGNPQQQAIDAELARRIRLFVRALPVKLRDALLLAATGDYTYTEMAAMLGAPPGTIKSRVFEARRLLRAKIGRER